MKTGLGMQMERDLFSFLDRGNPNLDDALSLLVSSSLGKSAFVYRRSGDEVRLLKNTDPFSEIPDSFSFSSMETLFPSEETFIMDNPLQMPLLHVALSPLYENGRLFGFLGVEGTNDLDTVERVAMLCSFALRKRGPNDEDKRGLEDYPVPSCVLDKNKTIISMNDSMRKLFGSIQCGISCKELIQSDGSICGACPIDQLEKDKTGKYASVILKREDGKRFLVICEHGRRKGEDVYLLFFQPITIDVKKDKEPLLTDDIVNVGVVEGYDKPGWPVRNVNRSFLEMLGFVSNQEFMDACHGVIMDFVHPSDLRKTAESIHRQIRDKGNYLATFRIRKKDGSYFWVRTKGRRHKNSGNGCTSIVSVFYDVNREVTQKLQAERMLARQKELEVQLSERQESLERAVDDAKLFYWEMDLKTHIVTYGSRLAQEMGIMPVEKHYPQALIDSGFIHDDDVACFRKNVDAIWEGKSHCEWDVRCRLNEGSPFRWVRCCVSVLNDQNGHPAKGIGTSWSIQVEKQLKSAYQVEMESRKSMEADLMESSRLNLTKGKVEDVFLAGESVMKSEYAFLMEYLSRVGLFLDDISLSNEDAASLSTESLLASFAKGVHVLEKKYHAIDRKTRKIRWIHLTVKMLTSAESGDVIAFFYNRDITKEHEKEEAGLRAARDRDMMGVAIALAFPLCIAANLTKDSYKLIEYETFDAPLMEKEGRYDSMLEFVLKSVHEDDRKAFANRFGRKSLLDSWKKGSEILGLTYREMGKEGAWHWNHTIGVFMKDSLSDDVLLTLLSDCVDASKESELKLKEALDDAWKASKAKSVFLSDMSHEIRTPMNAIIGLTKLAESEDGVSPVIRDYLEHIDSSSVYLLGIINDILDMSKIENGKLELHKEWTESKVVLGFCIDMIRPMMTKKHITFEAPEMSIFQKDMEICVDVQKTRQMLMNLLNNACKFTGEGGHVSLLLRHRHHDASVSVDEIIVKDDGCGMSKEFLGKVFSPFSQERNLYSGAVKGTGLGLALARQVAREMGGDIRVESELGKGTTFTITFPYRYRRVKANEERKELPSPSSPSLEGMRILVAEDHPLNAMIIQRLLEKRKISVIVVDDGLKARDAFSSSPSHWYDAILMDVRMPVMDGLAATRAIRTLDREDAKSVPIIAMTANAFDEDRKMSRKAGMNEHLSKPIEPEKLYLALENTRNSGNRA